MDYQTWLKAFSVELSHQWNGIAMDDLDPLHLQSLYHRGIGPADAAHLHPVLRDLAPDPAFSLSGSGGSWRYFVAGIAIVFAIGFLWQRHVVALDRTPSVTLTPHVASSPLHSYSNPYPAEVVNYGTFGSFPMYARRQTGQHSGSKSTAGTSTDRDDSTTYDDLDAYIYGAYEGPEPAASNIQSNLPFGTGAYRPSGAPATGLGAQDNNTPDIEQFQVTSSAGNDAGFSGQVTWQVANADQVQILLMEVPITTTTTLSGSTPFNGVPAGETFMIRASKGGRVVEQTATVSGDS